MIEHGHDTVIQFADFEGGAKKFLQIVRLVAQITHDFVETFVDVIICLSQNGGMLHVSGHSFQSIQTEQISAQDIIDFFFIVIECNVWSELNDRLGSRRD